MATEFDLKTVKCVIWDLDETFWKGTLSEEEVVPIEENINFVKSLNDHGIVNSICSKNDFEKVMSALENICEGLSGEFVFASVNWLPKGERIKNLISDMGLRPCNVLFLDDNHINLEEAKFYCPELMTAFPDDIPALIKQLSEFENAENGRKRLKQYKILEKKQSDRSKSSSNNEFLLSSEIKVCINKDCASDFERAYEIVHRTNQLNFTKIRSTREELTELFKDDSFEKGLVQVSDKYGDYGIVGFYAMKDHELKHFAFSCRTLGMGIEQYVYAMLGFPKLQIVPDVASELVNGFCPPYINNASQSAKVGKTELTTRVLFKGPCDLDQLFSFINANKNVKTEFSYVSNKIGSVVQYNHTINILGSLEEYPSEEMFVEPELYQTELFSQPYNSVFISLLPDTGLGVYRNKQTGKKIVFGDYLFSMTDEKNWEGFINKTLYTSGLNFTESILKEFSQKYEYEGLLSLSEFKKNLCTIREKLSADTKLYFITGAELEFVGNKNPAYNGRHLVHKKYNQVAREVCQAYDNTFIFDVNDYVKNQNDFTNSPNHFTRNIYYAMAQDITKLINDNSGMEIKTVDNFYLHKVKTIITKVTKKLKRIIRE